MLAQIFRRSFNSSIADDSELRKLLLVLVELAGRDATGSQERPSCGRLSVSFETIAEVSGLSLDTTRIYVDELIKAGELAPIDPHGWQIVNFESYHTPRPAPAMESKFGPRRRFRKKVGDQKWRSLKRS